ncbi:MAG: type II secretion system F family protein [Patescibacteria group bacterium]
MLKKKTKKDTSLSDLDFETENQKNSDQKIDESHQDNSDNSNKPEKNGESASQDGSKQNLAHYWKKFILYLENSGGVPLTQKIFLVQNLAIMLKAGLSLGESLQSIKKQSSNKKLQYILVDVTEQVEKGESFSSALANYPSVFNELFVSMIASGETSGNLEEVLKQIHIQLKRSHELISKVRGAMIYPAVVITAMVGIGIAMVIFVLPKFVDIFADFEAELPLPTRVLIWVSKFTQTNGIFVVLILAVILFSIYKFIKTKTGKYMVHKFFLTAPIISQIVKKINLARFARTLSSLIKTGIPIVNSFKITAKTLSNVYYKEALIESAEKIKKGTEINIILREYPKLFPPIITQMVTVGEESGSIEDILNEIAGFYEEEVDQTMKNLPAIIEPVLMLILGAGVGFMAVAVLMPMYSLGQAI